MKRVTVAIPVYDGKLLAQTVAALVTESAVMALSGACLTVRFLPSCSNLALGRNQLVKEFLASPDERLVFLDGDVSFEPGALLQIAMHKADFVGGAYRHKRNEETYPVNYLPEVMGQDQYGLIEVAMVPTGFLSLSRGVFEKFRERTPGREYEIDGHKAHCYFQIPYSEGHLYTEDAYFCREWREMGGKVHLDPNLTLTHWDFNRPYTGNIGNWLRSQMKEIA